MYNRLYEAACTGNTSDFHQLLQENPLILADYALISPQENPLHVATKSGQLVFVREVLRQKPELAKELNKDGFRPMDIASAFGYVEIVRELLTIGDEVCRLKGRDGRTALHYAAINGRTEVIDELISTCGESVTDVTGVGETALHLAVRYFKFESFRTLVQWLDRLGWVEMVNCVDRDGNSVLHLAVFRKQLQSVELLLSNSTVNGILELNAKNSRGLTAMDVLDIVIDSPSEVQLKDILHRAGAFGAPNVHVISLAPSPQQVIRNEQTEQEKDWFTYFKFQLQRDSPSDTRNALLVVAALIATVSFQAGVNPSSGFLPEKNCIATQSNSAPPPTSANPPGFDESIYIAARVSSVAIFAILGSVSTSTWFLIGNSLSLAASLSIIIYLTSGFPFQRELQISMYSMLFSYGCSISNIQIKGVTGNILLGIAFLLPFFLRWPLRWAKKAWKRWKQTSIGQVRQAIDIFMEN